jgi:hypothetical protein
MNKIKINIELLILKISLIAFVSTVLYMIANFGIINYISFNGI